MLINKDYQYVPFNVADGKNEPIISTYKDGIGLSWDVIQDKYLTPDFDIHLIVPKNLIVIDIDNHNVDNVTPFKHLVENKLVDGLNTQVVQTNTGLHLYFKNKIKGKNSSVPKNVNGPRVLKYFGFEIEIKNPKSNTIVKVATRGEMRKVFNEGTFAELPVEFTLFSNGNSLVGLTENRNNELLKIPNEYRSFVNSYVFGDPLSEHEVSKMSDHNDITSFDEDRDYLDDKGNILEYDFGQFLVEKLKIYDINYSIVFKNNDGKWANIKSKSGWKQFTKTLRQIEPKTARIYSKMTAYGEIVERECEIYSKADVAVHFNNITLLKGRVYNNVLNDVPSPYLIPFDYNPNAYDETMDKLLDRITSDPVDLNKNKTKFILNKAKRQLLIDIIAHCLLTQFTRNNQTMFILTGRGNNGKSTYEEIINAVFGHDLVSTVKLHTLAEKFQSYGLMGKLVNIGDDIKDDFIPNTDTLKSVVSGNPISLEGKNMQPIQNWKSHATQLFSANDLPKTRDRSSGWSRRIQIVPMNYDYKKDPNFVMDPKLEQKIHSQSAIEYIIKLAVERYSYVYENGPDIPQSVVEATEKYINTNNNVIAFIQNIKEEYAEDNGDEFWVYNQANEDPTTKNNDIDNTVDQCYAYYKNWCEGHGLKPFNKTKFIDTVLMETSYEMKKRDIKGAIQIDPNTNKKLKSKRIRFDYFVRKSSD